MKVLIEIPNNAYEWINEHKGVTDFKTTEMLYNRVRDGISLNGTNGDVLKAVFPNVVIVHKIRENKREIAFSDDCWNADYKAGSEDV